MWDKDKAVNELVDHAVNNNTALVKELLQNHFAGMKVDELQDLHSETFAVGRDTSSEDVPAV